MYNENIIQSSFMGNIYLSHILGGFIMAELNNLVRLLVPADKEFKVTAVTATQTATKFTSSLTSGYKRRAIAAYNNSHDNSGECYWGGSTVVAGNGMPIPKGSIVEVPVTTDLDIYFVADSGQIGDLRVIEIA
jgi:hypothetical protein